MIISKKILSEIKAVVRFIILEWERLELGIDDDYWYALNERWEINVSTDCYPSKDELSTRFVVYKDPGLNGYSDFKLLLELPHSSLERLMFVNEVDKLLLESLSFK